jgi:phenylpropionate dioxygenase-like ring-hydroxylating dioxygenase large terminal subunit
MGALMRQFWMPACLSSELLADGDPLRLMLLGEKLIAFRDTEGRIGILDHRCPHRCASLFFGRNEEGGIRCVYHGWKFDAAGNCLEMPNLPEAQNFSEKVKAKAYQAAERGGLVYVYMGERAVAPPLPALEVMSCPQGEMDLSCRQRECNWLQALEGDIDTSHFSFLHSGKVEAEDIDPDNMERFQLINRAPEYHVSTTDWGTMYTAYRPALPGFNYHRFGHVVMPFWALFPNGPLGDNVLAQAWVPMDDTHTMSFFLSWNRRTPAISARRTGEPIPDLERVTPTLPNTTDWFGRWRPVSNQSNDYLVDRQAQRTDSFSGIAGLFPQDSSVTESMGPITDRSLEHLATSDRMIAVTRRRLLDAARALRDHGTIPPLVDNPGLSAGARSGELVAPAGQSWLDAYDEAMGQAAHPGLRAAAE